LEVILVTTALSLAKCDLDQVEAGALKRLCPEMSSADAGFLKAFDAARKRIQEVADEVYVRGGKGSYAYTLAADDF
jgi:hypothetical protein